MNKPEEEDGARIVPGRKRPQVLKAARALFLSRGFASTTMDNIAMQAGVSKATLYSYFPGKSEVFTAIALNEVEALSHALADIGSNSELPFEEKLLEIGHRMLATQLLPENVNLFRMVIASAPRFPDLGMAMSSQCRVPVRSVITELMANACEQGYLRQVSPESAAMAFQTMMRGDLLLNVLMDPTSALVSQEQRDTHVRTQVALFLAAFAP